MNVSQVGGVRADIAQMLDKIREVSHREAVFSPISGAHTQTADFSKVMDSSKNLLSSVSDLQSKSEVLKDKYIAGDPTVSLSQVVVSSEKSKLAFEGLMIVRNKCLEAYKEIMNMPV